MGDRTGRWTTAAVSTAIAVVGAMLTAAPAAAERPAAERRAFVADATDTTVRGGAATGGFHDDARGRSGEVERLRTQASKTFVTGYGAYQTEFYTSSVHFRDGSRWAPIDNSLVASDRTGYGFRNRANRFALHLPRTIGTKPIRVEHGGAWASFSLDGASGAATAAVDGNRATYPGVFPGVDAAYEVLNDAIKEELLLTSAQATRSFTWTVRTSPGLTAAPNAAGGVDFSNAKGVVQFAVHSPVIYDASDTDEGMAPPHAYRLRDIPGGYEIALDVDRAWLESPAREFPVTVDPSVDFANRDCQIQDGDKAGTNFCTLAKIKVGNTGTYRKRALLRWDVSTIPDNAEVLDAKAGLWVEGAYGYTSNAFSLRALTEGPWENEATWNRRTAAATWSSPGSVFDDSKGYKEQDVPGTTGWVFWHPTDLVKQWVAGTLDNRGAVIKQTSETQVNGELHFTATESANTDHWPTLTVTWDQGGMGSQKTYALEEHRLTDRADLAVNPAGGNLSVRHTDLEISGTGLDLKIERTYNSLLPVEALDTGSHAGDGWSLGTAGDVGLKLFEDGSAAYFDASGYRAPYTRDPEDPLQKQSGTKAFVTPPGPDADLHKVNVSAQRTYKLTKEKSKDSFYFSDRGVLTSHEDKNGNAIQFTYSGDLLTSIRDTQGRVVNLDYDTAGNVVAIQDSAGRVHRYAYEGQNLVRYTNPQNETTSYAYNGGHLASITDPEGNVTRFAYDASWRVKSITVVDDKGDADPANDTTHATTFTYNASDSACPQEEGGYLQGTVVTDMRGNDTRYCYNKTSRVREIRDAKGNPTSMQYNSDANVTSVTNGNGKTVFGYDATGQDVVSVSSPDESAPSGGSVAGTATNLEYGEDGHTHGKHEHLPVKITTAENFSTEFDYDANHNLVRVAKAPNTLNHVFSYEYDARGNVTRIAAPEGPPDPDPANNDPSNDTTFDYYPNGDLHRINYPQPLGPVTFEYDTVSRVVAMTDGEGHRTQFTYDAVDRLTSITYSDGSSITYQYDRAGNVIRESDAEQAGATPRTADYVYDSRNRLVQETRATDRSTVRYTYDAVGNLTSVDDDDDGSPGRVEYRYDSTNVLDRITEPDGDHITYEINSSYKPWQISYPAKDGTTDQRVIVDIRYWNSGKVKSIKGTAPGATQPFTHLQYDYTNDATGKQQSLVHKITDKDGKVTKFEYDQLSRLARAETTHNGSLLRFFAYDYDANSNRTFENDNGTRTQYHYSPANTLTCSYGGDRSSCDLAVAKTTYSYDAAGNLTSENDSLTAASPDVAYTYDARNHNTRVRMPDGTTVDFDYLGATQERRLTKKVTTPHGASSTRATSHNALGVGAEAVWDSTETPTFYVRDNEGRPVGRFAAGAAAEDYYLLDAQGSVTDVFDKSGSVLKAYTYEPYGEIWWQSAGDVYNPLRFGQGYLDSETGLLKLGVRYYDNDTARFTQVDPIKGSLDDPVTLNLYQYAKCSPVNFSDPTGRSVCDSFLGDLASALNPVSSLFGFASTLGTGFSLKLLGSFGPATSAAAATGTAGTVLNVVGVAAFAFDVGCAIAE